MDLSLGASTIQHRDCQRGAPGDNVMRRARSCAIELGGEPQSDPVASMDMMAGLPQRKCHFFKFLWANNPWNPNPQAELSSCALARLS